MADETNSTAGITRREFLYYVWGASMAMFTAQFAGLFVWFALPRFREGQFGGTFTVPRDRLPGVNDPPVDNPDGRFWLVNVDSGDSQGQERMYRVADDPDRIVGVAALYKVCTHLGCIYKWAPTANRFECPCHGSKYRLDGRRIESPAPRSIDRFEIAALDASENVVAQTSAGPDNEWLELVLPASAVALRVNTGSKRDGTVKRLLCELFDNCP